MSRLQQGISKLNSLSGTGGSGSGTSRLSSPGSKNFDELKRQIHSKLVERLDFTRIKDLSGEAMRREIRRVVEHLCDTENPLLNRIEREKLIEEVLDETLGIARRRDPLQNPSDDETLARSPRFLIAKYVPDVFRNEPRNIGVVLWSPDGVVARFAGEKPDAPGEVDDTQIPPFVVSPEAYKQWVRYWRREIGKETVRPAVGGPSVPRTSPAFLDTLGQTGPGNYLLAGGGLLLEPVTAAELTRILTELFLECVAAGEIPVSKG